LRASFAARQATSGICYRTLQYADSQVNKLEITPDKHYLAGTHQPTQPALSFVPANLRSSVLIAPASALQLLATRPSGCSR
jgi:hypothetical protein